MYLKYVTVSAKIDEELRMKLKELGIKPSKVIKEALEKEVEKKMMEKLYKSVEEVSKIILEVGREKWVRAIRESRDEK